MDMKKATEKDGPLSYPTQNVLRSYLCQSLCFHATMDIDAGTIKDCSTEHMTPRLYSETLIDKKPLQLFVKNYWRGIIVLGERW
jgi:hypothetical protein